MPDLFQINKTEDKPSVFFDKQNNIFKIEGKSLPENSKEFYDPILEWISEYVKQPNKETDFVCKIDYFNSSSARKFFEIFKELEKIKDSGNSIQVTWCHSAEDKLMEIKGQEFKSVVGIPFKVEAV